MGKVKGTAWISLTNFLARAEGPEAYARVLAKLAPKDAAQLQEIILPISWLEYGVYVRFLLAADLEFGHSDHALFRESSRVLAQENMHGVYRIFLKVVSPAFVLSKVAQLWHRLMDPGEMRLTKETRNSVELTLTEFPDMPLHHEIGQSAFMEEIARMTGLKQVSCTHPKCLARGDDHCLYVVSWE